MLFQSKRHCDLAQVIDDPGTDNLLLVMEYVDGGTLEQPTKGNGAWERIPEKLIQKHVREICRVKLASVNAIA